MRNPLYRLTVLALYQCSLVAGILFLPVALLARHVGVHLQLGRIVERLGRAYDEAAAK